MRSNRDNGPEVNELELGNVFELYFITNVVEYTGRVFRHLYRTVQ